ncbi:arylesterase [Sphingomonas sp.]|uniref:arylesterase n=1 Tax=Sphingomonas sp. TaxID=28214 RepID=UPI003B00971F
MVGLLAAPAAAGPLIWALGDSLTAGYGLPPAQGFTARLQEALRAGGIDATVANGGVSGDTTAQGRARLLWGLRGLGRVPDLAIVELGANDMLRGLPVAQARANIDAILTEFDRRRVPVLIAGMRAAPNLGSAYATAFDAMYPALARAHRARLYSFFLAGVAGRRELIQADGLHPNARGVAIIVAGIAPAVRGALPRPATARARR